MGIKEGVITKTYNLKNGLTIIIYDRTFLYFGTYYTVFFELVAEVPVKTEYFDNEKDFDEALVLLGDKQYYRREIKKEGVYQEELSKAKEEVLKYLEEHSLNYLGKTTFLEKFIKQRWREEKRKKEIELLREKIVE